MRGIDAPELVRKPESVQPEVFRVYDHSSSDHNVLESYNAYEAVRHPPGDERANSICGMKISIVLFAVVMAIIVVGASIGGAVGGSLAVQRASAGPPTSSTVLSAAATAISSNIGSSLTTTPYTSIPTSGVSVPLDCPNLGGKPYEVAIESMTWTFTLACGMDYPLSDQDIIGITAYTMDDCIHACASYNYWWKSNNCIVAVFNADVSDAAERFTANCWIKNGTKNPHGPNNRFIAAKLNR